LAPKAAAQERATLGHDRRNGLLAPFGVAAGHHDGGSGHQHTQIVQFRDNS
jgi:hypothetical protein